MNSDDPRIVTLELREVIEREYGQRWPKPGEEIVLNVTSAGPLPAAQNSTAPPIRHVALDPGKFEGSRITVVGQFRGRNLYADLPDAPTGARDDFVLRSGDAALWVTGVRPRGKGFSFDPTRRVDTGRWVRVAGTVRHGRGLVWIEGTSIELAEAPTEDVAELVGPPLPPPPLDVVFTSPSDGEGDVPLDSPIRVQFSRDLDVASLTDRLRITASPIDAAQPGATPPTAVAFGVSWTPVTRALEIRPTQPFEPFQRVRVEFLEGVRGPDGAQLRPFSLSFATGAGRSRAVAGR
ncbi:MAG: Ig-like domain-containing protein [Acidobacteria bacterium]|nr:Ig-like domain-containing protein [Acidobacteriota bacterium]